MWLMSRPLSVGRPGHNDPEKDLQQSLERVRFHFQYQSVLTNLAPDGDQICWLVYVAILLHGQTDTAKVWFTIQMCIHSCLPGVPILTAHDQWIAPVALVQTWKIMVSLQERGFCRSIGVSNMYAEELQAICDSCTVFPCINQVRCTLPGNVYLQRWS